MRPETSRAVIAAILLHLVIVVVFVVIAIVSLFIKPEPEEHVFRLVSSGAVAEAPLESPAPPLETPVQEPLPELQTPDLPQERDLPELPPETPLVELPPEPEPTPPPPEEPPPQAMSFDDFMRSHGQPRSARVQPRPQTRTVETPEIDLSDLRQSMRALAQTPIESRSNQSTAISASVLESYFATIRQRLYRYWERPQMGGVQLVARVQFVVSASGTLSNARIQSSSGNPAFDQSVLEAFRRLGAVDPPPTGERFELALTFRLID